MRYITDKDRGCVVHRSGLTEESECVSVDTFLVLTCLGWLFEVRDK